MKNRQSIRLRQYDYSLPGAYFVTICVRNRECLFGKIANGIMLMNQYGTIVNNCWFDLPNHYKNIKLDYFVIMPNHIHGIIVIKNPIVGARSSRPSWNWCQSEKGRDDLAPTSNGRKDPTPTLGKIVAFFKYQTTKQFNELQCIGMQKLWQRNYYEHIIRNKIELNKIR